MKLRRGYRLVALALLVFSIAWLAFGCTTRKTAGKQALAPQDQPGAIKVYTSFYPLYDFTKKIAGDKADVINLQPVGVEPHDFEPSPQQVANLYTGRVFIFLGGMMDPWAGKIQDQLKKDGVITLAAGQGLMVNNDPHIWLDPVLAKEMARRICSTLVAADGGNKDYYEQNLHALEQKLDTLDRQYRQTLTGLPRKEIVTSHAAFAYLVQRYGLEQIAISGLSPQEEPAPQQMARLVTLCRSKGVKYIFFETLASPKLAETLARETGAGTLVLNPVGGLTPEEVKAGEDYFTIMAKNLANLKKALE
ncbi:metal ABC transporter substrate-binding protein [Moorella sp. Hama-1]|uniref:metal ABC transporter substrate-binding protein n=1 Tax=Moorella sp. Hama-1 TaxID=2138101 RepID=UPI000D64CF98|nr:metal ABC transporter substrate-binding protein [Moorella sp. Hama-1]BCV21720.1 zinc ABC transporter substrate-binding protein [Moorella sp. Hama-1]